MSINKTPYIEEALLDYLEEVFPDRAPNIDASDRQIWVRVGAVQVVRHLRMLFNEQNGLMQDDD